MLGGSAITVGLPLLDCFLNTNGDALAATGAPLPPIFGTWFQHLGLNPGMWEPEIVGPNYKNNIQLEDLNPFRDRLNIYSGLKYFIEGKPLQTHTTSSQIATTGEIPFGTKGGPSIDSSIASVIGLWRYHLAELAIAIANKAARRLIPQRDLRCNCISVFLDQILKIQTLLNLRLTLIRWRGKVYFPPYPIM